MEDMTLEQLADKALDLGFLPPNDGENAREYYINCLKQYEASLKAPLGHEKEDLSGDE